MSGSAHLASRFARASALLVFLALVGGVARAGEPPAPPDPAESLADGLTSRDARQRAQARERLEGATPEQARAVAVELARRLLPKAPVVRHATSNVGVEATLRFVDASPEAVASLRGTGRASTASGPTFFTAAETDRWLDAVAHTPGARLLTTPRVTTYDGQRSCAQETGSKAYVADYERLETPQGPVAHPVVRTAVEGLSTGLRATVSADRRYVSLALDVELRQLASPMAEDRVTLPGISMPLVVQRPEISGVRWSRTVTVADGGSALVWLPSGFGADEAQRDHLLALLVTTKVVTLDVTPGAAIVDFDPEDAFRVGPDGPLPPIARPPAPEPSSPTGSKTPTPATK